MDGGGASHHSHVLHTTWVFKRKTDMDGVIERDKDRLVVCGNEQLFGVDYGVTFAAVMKLSTVKVVLVFVETVCAGEARGNPKSLRKGRQGREFGYSPGYTVRYRNPQRRYAEARCGYAEPNCIAFKEASIQT